MIWQTPDKSVGWNESPEKIEFLFCQIIVFQSSLRMYHWILNQKIAREHCFSQANYEFMFILSDTKNGKNMGRFANHG